MTVVPGSMQASITAITVSTVLSGRGPMNTDHLVYALQGLKWGGKRENIGHELRDQEAVKEALYNIVQRNAVLLLNLCIIFFSKK